MLHNLRTQPYAAQKGIAAMKRKTVWVSRDGSASVKLWKLKPCKSLYGYFYGGDCAITCHKFFRAVTGLKIKPGECVEVAFSARKVKRMSPDFAKTKNVQ
jgi:hypothetical protein